MRALTLLTLAALGRAATVPRSVADGIYGVSLDARGQEVHTRLPDRGNLTSPQDLSTYDRREEKHNLGRTVDDLNTYCTSPIPAGAGGKKFDFMSVYSKRGNVVAFACKDPKFQWAQATGNDLGLVMHAIGARCGRYVESSANFKVKEDGTKSAITFGIMRLDSPDLDFCAKATASPKSTCVH
ncbi:hypothetical protein ACCO45_006989 [Purpureocillium lilacinum]|uniref:Uncharacterized protein n=1 Tax=Purpureocillium lilacinum TaxID=33203 RepID=A0ACC4DRW3_PURLI